MHSVIKVCANHHQVIMTQGHSAATRRNKYEENIGVIKIKIILLRTFKEMMICVDE